jgi:translation elongation factor EF-Ts
MPEITAAMVKALRERTGLPMMECKKALEATGGDEEKAVEKIRKDGIKTKETRIGRETSAGRIAVYTDFAQGVGAMVELQCESAPVASGKDFIQFANDLAKQLATGPGASSGEELLKQSIPGKTGQTFADSLVLSLEESFYAEEKRFHTDRAACRYRHHRDSGCYSFPRIRTGTRKGTAGKLHEQPQADRSGGTAVRSGLR